MDLRNYAKWKFSNLYSTTLLFKFWNMVNEFYLGVVYSGSGGATWTYTCLCTIGVWGAGPYCDAGTA